MPVLGSVFLGDAHHHRVFTTTPPTSPPPSSASPSFTFRAPQARADSASAMDKPKLEVDASLPAVISPEISLELRLRWLEALLLGVRQDATKETRKHATEGRATNENGQKRESIIRRAEEVQRRLNGIVASNDGFKRFMEHCLLILPDVA